VKESALRLALVSAVFYVYLDATVFFLLIKGLLFDINAIGRAVRTMELHEMCVLEGLNL
jgi:hypothetical protein